MTSFSPGCACCCTTYGFEHSAYPEVTSCCQAATAHVTHIYQDISKLAQVTVVFCGPSNQCGMGIRFVQSDWPAVKSWVENGGRLYVAGEYDGCIDPDSRTKLNSFLSAIGCSMQVGLKTCNCGCSQSWLGQPQPVKIMQEPDNLPGIYHACVGQVVGGTPVCKTNPETAGDPNCSTPFVFIAIENVGQGYVMLTADSNVTGGCSYDNCELWKRFAKNEELI